MKVRGCEILINVIASDGYDSVNQTFVLDLINTFPYNYKYIHEKNGKPVPIRVHVNEKFTYTLEQNTFLDPDREEPVLYFQSMLSDNDSLPQWLIFQKNSRQYTGTAGVKDLLDYCKTPSVVQSQDPITNGMNEQVYVLEQICPYSIKLKVSDGCDFVETLFDLVLYNTRPYRNQPIAVNLEGEEDTLDIHIGDAFSFYIKSDVFADCDSSDTVTYQLKAPYPSVVPSWLNYNRFSSKLFGVPSKEDFYAHCSNPLLVRSTKHRTLYDGQVVYPESKICSFTLVIVASDGYDKASQEFRIRLGNTLPIAYEPIYQVNGVAGPVRVKVNTNLDFHLPLFSFIEFDKQDTLVYNIQMAYTHQSVPQWFYFDSDLKSFLGTPNNLAFLTQCTNFSEQPYPFDDILNFRREILHPLEKRCTYTFNVTAEDPTETAWQVFTVEIYDICPFQFMPLYHQNGIQMNYRHHQGDFLEFFIHQQAVQDADKDVLILTMKQARSDQLPGWLSYDTTNGRIFGTPLTIVEPLIELQLVVSDTYFTIRCNLTIELYNNPPQSLGKINPKYIDFDQQISIQIPSAEIQFTDLDNDPLSYALDCGDDKSQENGWIPIEFCSTWLKFDNQKQLIYGTAQGDFSIPYKPELQKYYKEYLLRVSATDPGEQTGYSYFYVIVEHAIPQINRLELPAQTTYQNQVQEKSLIVKPGIQFEFYIPMNIFTKSPFVIAYFEAYIFPITTMTYQYGALKQLLVRHATGGATY